MDRGANGGILGQDARPFHSYIREVDVTGIARNSLAGLTIVDAAAKMMSNRGPIIGIMMNYAFYGKDRTIHSSGQLEHYGNIVDDRSMKVGGRQCIRTNDGYIIPLDIINGLPYLKMEKHTDKEWEELPHVVLTAPGVWDPTVLDNVITDHEEWADTIKDLDEGLIQTPFDEFGNYRKREPTPEQTFEQDLAEEEEDKPAVDTRDPVPLDAELEVDWHETKDADLRECFMTACNLNAQYIVNDNDTVTTAGETVDSDSEDDVVAHAEPRQVNTKPYDYEKYRPYFLHVPIEKVRKTFERTTQYATNVMSGLKITQTIQSPYPALNVLRRNEPVATDTIFAEVPAVDTGGQTMAQIFVGRKSLVIDVYGMGTEKEFVNTLEDVIRKRGAMDKLISDSARVEISRRVKDILRNLIIDDWQSEANYQHQNFSEHRYKFLKKNTQWIMSWRNVAPNAWLLCIQWVADVMNHTAEKSLDWRPPLEVLTGQTIDISIMLCFMFWDVVYVSRYPDDKYSGQVGSEKSEEIRGRFVGFAWDVGHAMTFKVLTDDTQRVIKRSKLRLAKVGENNLKLDVEAGAVPERIYIKSKRDEEGDDLVLPTIDMSTNPFTVEDNPDVIVEETPQEELQRQRRIKDELDYHSPYDDPSLRDTPVVETVDDEDDLSPHLKQPERKPGDPNPQNIPRDFTLEDLSAANPVSPNLPPEEMIERTFLMPEEEDGSRYRAKIIERIQASQEELAKDPELIKFKCRVNDKYDEVVAYNDIVDFIEQDQTWDGLWKFKEILRHQGPLRRGNKNYKGARYNVLVEWETGEKTWEPITTADKKGVYDTDRVTVAIYARKHGLLDTPGWKLPGLKKIAKTQQRIIRIANQAKLNSYRTKPVYMYGFLVPKNYQQAMDFDKANGNTKWKDSVDLELKQQDDYDTFDDKGPNWKPDPGYKKITVHLVFAVKHDGRHKARLVAGGHLTDTPVDSVYSSVVSLRGIRMLTFLAEHNDMELWATDIGNAYLESFTKEKVYIKAGAEFGDREGHYLVIVKALYGLKSSGLRWHERFADVLRSMKFFPSRAEPDIWMRDMGDHYEYIAVYVDDLLIVSRKAQDLIDAFTKEHNFKLKGTGPISFHLGCDFFRDEDGVLCYAPRKYIIKCLDNYKRIFGTNPKQASSPLVKGNHPELDTSPLLDVENTKIYQSLIGGLQWSIQIGRFDVGTATMTMSRFRAAPREGHLDRVKRIFGYLSKMRNGVIRIRTEEPDYSHLTPKEYEWFYTCYGGAEEELPSDAPRPLGKRIITTSYVDANLYHDLISGKSVTGILHFFNKTPIDWYTKLQSTVETATFGSEYIAARTCTEQIIDLRNTLRYLGVPVEGPSYMFGDNETVVNTASVPHGKLHKRHNALAFHKTRWCIAARIVYFHHVKGDTNPADILRKHWDYPSIWSQLRPLLFWKGDTGKLLKDSDDGDDGKDGKEDNATRSKPDP